MRRSRQVALPERLRAALEEILATPVEHVRVIEHSWFARLHGRAVATTRRGRIYLRGSAADFFGNPALVLHEYCHVIRQWQAGALTVTGYLTECLRRGYWNNRFEVEARTFAELNIQRLHTLVTRGAPSAQERLALVEPRGDRHQERPQ